MGLKSLFGPESRLLKNLTRNSTLDSIGIWLELRVKPLNLHGYPFDSSRDPIESRIFSLVNFFKSLDSGHKRLFFPARLERSGKEKEEEN